MLSLFLPFLMFFTTPAHATSIELEVSQSTETKSQQISANGKFASDEDNTSGKKDKNTETKYRWDLSYTHTSVEVKQQSGGSIVDTSHDVTLGASLETVSNFYLAADLDYSRTPDENLQS
ncbi:MAG: hypothetical protein ACM3MG_05965, partial [Bacillota bacterium]